MHLALSPSLRRRFIVVLASLALLGVAGCAADPFVANDTHVLLRSPGYLRGAWIYSNKDAAADAAERFRAGDYRLCALVSLGEHYPGCQPGVGEKYARRHGTILLPRTAGAVEIDAQETYRNVVWNYAATYNHEMVALLGPLDARPHASGVTISGK